MATFVNVRLEFLLLYEKMVTPSLTSPYYSLFDLNADVP